MSSWSHIFTGATARSLAILAMVLQISTVILHGQGLTISSTRSSDTGLLTMVICSPDGLKQITIDDHGNIVDEKIPAQNSIDCPFNAAISSNHLLAPTQAASVLPPSKQYLAHQFSGATKRLATLSYLATPARSPPFGQKHNRAA